MEGIVINAGAQNTLNPKMIKQEPGDSPNLLMSQKAITVMAKKKSMSSIMTLDVPTFVENLTYTGDEIAPQFYGYDKTCMDVSGTTQATGAGTYTATFTPREGYAWGDGVSDRAVSVAWIIRQAAGFCDADTTEVTLRGGTSVMVPFRRGWNAEIKITNASPSIATATASGNLITVTGHAKGDALITIEAVGTSNYTKATEQISVTVLEAVPIPSQLGTLTYNKSAQTPQWNNYTESKLTPGGTTSATNAGTYAATFKPKPGYCWQDGGTDERAVNWIIEKAEGTLTVNVTNPVTLTVAKMTYTYTVAVGPEDLIVSKNYGDATIAGVANTNKEWRAVGSTFVGDYEITAKKKGTTIFTHSVKPSDTTPNSTVPKPVSFIINCNIPSSNLSECTWAEIRSATNAGVATKLWQVGDLSPFVSFQGWMGGTYWDEVFNFRIVEMTDTEIWFFQAQNRDGVEIALCDEYYWQVRNAGAAGLYMRAPSTNTGGYKGSYADKQIAYYYDAALPADLRSAWRSTNMWADNVGGLNNEDASAITIAQGGPIFMPSQIQVAGTTVCTNPHIADRYSQWTWFKNGNSWLAYSSRNPSQDVRYWLSDASINTTNHFRATSHSNSSGLYSYESATSLGIRLGFRI